MATPSREEVQKSFAKAWANAEWEYHVGRPRRARETARAWVGMIELMVMGSSEGYTRAFSTPYQPPRTVVIPAAPKISLMEMGFSVTYLPAGSPFRFYNMHLKEVLNLFTEPLTVAKVPLEQYSLEVTLPEDRVCLTWHDALAPVSSEGPEPFNTFLLTPDGKEHETSRVTTRLLAVFATEEAATQWVKTRAYKLEFMHNLNHVKQCEDEACAERGHTYEPGYDD